jgi:hypothetical protein
MISYLCVSKKCHESLVSAVWTKLTLPLLNKNPVLPAWHLGPRGTIRCLNEGHYIIDQLERSDWNFFLILPTMRLWDVGDYALWVGQACIENSDKHSFFLDLDFAKIPLVFVSDTSCWRHRAASR